MDRILLGYAFGLLTAAGIVFWWWMRLTPGREAGDPVSDCAAGQSQWLQSTSKGGVRVLVEIDGKKWHVCVEDSLSGLVSHIVEPAGMINSPMETFE